MKKYEKKIRLITPLFASGSKQSKPEIRPSEIKNLFRWWWNLLFVNSSDIVFGKINDKNNNKAAKGLLSIRVIEDRLIVNEDDFPQRLSQEDPFSYLAFFGFKTRVEKHNSFYSPGTTFTIQIISKIKDVQLISNFEKTMEMVFAFGSFGLRSRRGFGAYTTDIAISYEKFSELIEELSEINGFSFFSILNDEGELFCLRKWKKIMSLQGTYLKQLRGKSPKEKFSAGKLGKGNPSFLGSSGNRFYGLERQASALHLRPVLLDDGDIVPFMFLYQGKNSLHPKVGKAKDVDMFIEFSFENKNFTIE